ncbi:MAG: hypothetical protein ACFB9M_16725 [Myxococcota bacterium]
MRSVEARLQAGLEAMYRLQPTPPIDAFCLTPTASAREVLLVRHDPDADETHIGLMLCREATNETRRLISGKPARSVDSVALVLEGISHFVYFTHCGQQERPVSRVELELQAEIDKFMALWLWFGADPEALVSLLFDRFSLQTGLSADDEARYRTANREARRYAMFLVAHHRAGRRHHALANARRLYRSPLPTKLGLIASSA